MQINVSFDRDETMSKKTDTEPEVDKSGDDEIEQSGKEKIDESGREIVHEPGDDIVDESGDGEIYESGDKKEDSRGVKLPPLVKSAGSAKYSDKTVSSKSSAASFYLKSPKYSIWDRSNVDSVLTDYGYTAGEAPPLQRPQTQERRNTGRKSFSFDDSEVVKAQDTRESRKEYYLKIYEDIHKLRDYCREEYFEKLEEKVGKQRRNMKKKNVVFMNPSGGSSLSHLSNGEAGASDTSHTTLDSRDSAMHTLPHIMETKTSTSNTQLMTDGGDKTHRISWISDKSVETMGSSLSHLSNGEAGASDTSHTTLDSRDSAMHTLPHIMETKSSTSNTQLMTDGGDKTHRTSWISDKSVETMKGLPKRRYFVSKINRKPKRDVFLARNYLKNVPKSDHYKIIQLEEKLRAEGKFKTQADVDEFWCTIRRPEVFKKYFLVTEQRTHPHSPVSQTPITMVATLSNPMQQAAQADAPASTKPMDKILDYWLSPTVDNLRDRGGHVTTQAKRTKSLVPPAPVTTKKEDDPFHRARKAAAELDQKHPQMGIPRLNCFYMDLEEQQRDPTEAERELRIIKHSKERLLFVKRLHRMYSLANANLASMQRILEKREEVDLIPFQAGCTVVSDLIPTQVIHSTPEPTVVESHSYRPWMKYIERKREINPIQEVSEGGTGASERGTVERASISKSDRCMSGERSVRVHMQDTVPICWESLVQDDDIKVMGSTTPSFYWFNYLGAGKKDSTVPETDIDPNDLFKSQIGVTGNP